VTNFYNAFKNHLEVTDVGGRFLYEALFNGVYRVVISYKNMYGMLEIL
jgi:hypothetical protein